MEHGDRPSWILDALTPRIRDPSVQVTLDINADGIQDVIGTHGGTTDRAYRANSADSHDLTSDPMECCRPRSFVAHMSMAQAPPCRRPPPRTAPAAAASPPPPPLLAAGRPPAAPSMHSRSCVRYGPAELCAKSTAAPSLAAAFVSRRR